MGVLESRKGNGEQQPCLKEGLKDLRVAQSVLSLVVWQVKVFSLSQVYSSTREESKKTKGLEKKDRRTDYLYLS